MAITIDIYPLTPKSGISELEFLLEFVSLFDEELSNKIISSLLLLLLLSLLLLPLSLPVWPESFGLFWLFWSFGLLWSPESAGGFSYPLDFGLIVIVSEFTSLILYSTLFDIWTCFNPTDVVTSLVTSLAVKLIFIISSLFEEWVFL